MTIINKKSNPVSFDPDRHFSPKSKVTLTVKTPYYGANGKRSNISGEKYTVSGLVQTNGKLNVFRLRENPHLGEWVK